MMTHAAIEVHNIKKTYISYERKGFIKTKKIMVEALKGISFNVQKNEVFGLLGPNGAGKTTTAKIISTLLIPDEGYVKVFGYDTVSQSTDVRKFLGVSLSVNRGFYWKLTGKENLKYFGLLYGLDGKDLETRLDEVLDLVGLKKLGAENKLWEEYSLGMKARLSLARALLTDPPVIILDEPTLGLDPPSAKSFRNMLKKLAHEEGKTVLITTHNMFEAEIIADRLAIIDKGKIIALGTVEELKNIVKENVSIEIIFTLLNEYIDILRKNITEKLNIPIIIRERQGYYCLKATVLNNEYNETLSYLLNVLHGYNGKISNVKIQQPTLEDVFIKITGREGFK